MRYAGVVISGALGAIGGLAYIVPPVQTWNFEVGVAGAGFLAMAVMIFGQWKPFNICGAAMFFAVFKSLANIADSTFLALAVMIFGNWKPVNIAVSSLLFGLFKCIAASYASIDINGDGVFMLAEIGISAHLYRMLPYIVTLLVLAFTSKSSRAPKAEGIPYDKGSR